MNDEHKQAAAPFILCHTNSLALSKRESRAITKMTAWCALSMHVLKNFGNPWLCLRLLVPKLLTGFCCDILYYSAYKIEVRSFTHSWDNKGYPENWAVPKYAHASYSPKFLKGFCLHGPCACTGNLKSVALPIPQIIGGT